MAEKTAEATEGHGKKPAATVPTKYLVQRRIEGGSDKHPHWEDLREVETTGAEKAIRLAAGEGENANAGEYRAFPVRSDNRVVLEVEHQVKLNFTPVENGRAQTTREAAGAAN